jgi:undecaprenyl-diphosphatase
VQAVVDDVSQVRTSSRAGTSRRSAGHWLQWLVGLTLLVVLVALSVGVVTGSRLVDWDEAVFQWVPQVRRPGLTSVLDWWVVLGQRAVCLAIAVIWLGLRWWRTRDARPLGVLLVATLLTNVAVGGMKEMVGRLGPLQLGVNAGLPGASDIFTVHGTIFPSGHTANAVVTWGVLVLVAGRYRRTGAVLATVVAVTVGLTTVYLGTHWITDVVAGWCAGGLVLLVLPAAMPVASAAAQRVRQLVPRRRRRSDRPAPAPLSTAGSR